MTPNTLCRPLAALVAATALGALGAQAPQLPPMPVPDENPITAHKAVLGKVLFWDEQLSSDDTVACGTCHRPGHGGADPRVGRLPGRDGRFRTGDDVLGSPGIARYDARLQLRGTGPRALRPQVTGRTAPSFLDAGYAFELFWDGRADYTFRDPVTDAVVIPRGGALESQAVGPILNPIEMAHEGRTWDQVTGKLAKVAPLALATDWPADVAAAIAARRTYPDLFRAAFGDPAMTPVRIAMAIATYERTLVSDRTPYDEWAAGNRAAMTRNQRRGFDDFRRARCDECHTPPHFTDFSYRNIGVRPSRDDGGRRDVTHASIDRGKFKVPSLRNVGLRPRLMHNGSVGSVGEALRLYRGPRGRGRGRDNVDPILQRGLRFRLGTDRRAPIVDFLENALTDLRVALEIHPFDRPTLRSERDARR